MNEYGTTDWCRIFRPKPIHEFCALSQLSDGGRHLDSSAFEFNWYRVQVLITIEGKDNIIATFTMQTM